MKQFCRHPSIPPWRYKADRIPKPTPLLERRQAQKLGRRLTLEGFQPF
jgi:hypothetical protein